jgi:hypothetical protein
MPDYLLKRRPVLKIHTDSKILSGALQNLKKRFNSKYAQGSLQKASRCDSGCYRVCIINMYNKAGENTHINNQFLNSLYRLIIYLFWPDIFCGGTEYLFYKFPENFSRTAYHISES